MLSLALGFGIAFWYFALLFNGPADTLYRAGLVPLAFTAVLGAVVGWLARRRWLVDGIMLCAPTVLTCMTVGSSIATPGFWGHWACAIATTLASIVGAAIGGRYAERTRR